MSARQAEVLELQAAELRESLEERRLEAEGKRSAQASSVYLILKLTPVNWAAGDPPPATITAEVVNTSDQPAYAAGIAWPEGYMLNHARTPNPESLGDILPRTRITAMRDYPADWNQDLTDLAFRFTDAAGVKWIRRPDGYLAEQE